MCHFLGDLHGDFGFYFQWLSQKNLNDYTFVLGDVGLGFYDKYDKQYNEGIKKYSNAWFLRGNHDSPEVCKQQKAYLGDFGIFKDKIFFISGAFSIDYDCRTPGKDWWRDEEISIQQCEECIRLYENTKPDIIISHDCPNLIRDMVVMPIGIKPTRTGLLLDELFNLHQPSIFIFAHYHVRRDFNYLGTRFKCLDVQETFSIDL
jgi:hypothetical protein